MSPVGLSVGFWSPQSEIGDVARFCDRIREICGPCSLAFPFVLSPVKDEKGQIGLSYGVIRGHVPVHVDRPNAAEACSSVFTLVLEAENRPVLLFSPAGQREAGCIYAPEESRVASMAFGAIELIPGRAVHFDVARSFHGITGFPTGDFVPELPEAVVIQVPWARKDDIGGAIHRMRELVRRDERFADLVQTGGRDAVRGD